MSFSSLRSSWLFWLFLVGILLALVAECALRIYGLRQIPLYRADERYEYIYLPNQEVRPRGVLIQTNDLGLRSRTLKKKKGKRVLVMGDSVINGSYNIDQDSLATTLLDGKLNANGAFEVINLSMNSWGPENVAAFISAHGDQDPDLAILVVSSHDAFDNMTFEPFLGEDPSYPLEKPMLAIGVAFNKLKLKFSNPDPDPKYLQLKKEFNTGFDELHRHFEENEIPFAIFLHYELPELSTGKVDYRGQQIIELAESKHIDLYHGPQHGERADLYSDIIHLNASGQRVLANALYAICDMELNEINE